MQTQGGNKMADAPQSVLTDPVFSASLTDGAMRRASLPELLEAVDAGTLLDLTGLRSHQRGPVVTTLAILRTVLRMYGAADSGYAEVWRSQVGDDAARICAPYSEVAFFQPPLLVDPHLPKSLDAVDVAFTDVRHEVKGSGDVADAETWIYALWSGMLRIYVKDNVSGSRWGNAFIIPGDGVSIGSEILHLSEAYLSLAQKDHVADLFPARGASAADHLIFLQPLEPKTAAVAAMNLPFPFIEAPRAVRLFETAEAGVYSARQMTLNAPRIDVKAINENLIDPHVPISKGRPYRLIKGRRFDYRFVSSLLFAPEKGDIEEMPYTLTMDRPVPAVRICALRTDQGKTTGYYEKLIPVQKKKLRLGIGKKDTQPRLSFLSAYGLRASADIQSKAVFAAAARMYGESTDISAAAAGAAVDAFRSTMDDLLPLWVLDRAAEPADLDADMETYAAIAVPAATKAVEMADRAAATASPLAKARAWSFFDYAMSKGKTLEGYNLMKAAKDTKKTDDTPDLVRRVSAVMASLAGRIKAEPDVTKTLRTMAVSSRPIAYWRLAQELPVEVVGGPVCDVILKGLGSIDHVSSTNGGGAPGFGSILARCDFPESRMDRLVTAGGETLCTLVDEAWRFAVAKGATKADWRSLAGLLIADAMQDYEAVTWFQKKMAMEYVRVPAASKAAA
jgi:hypothetical protein